MAQNVASGWILTSMKFISIFWKYRFVNQICRNFLIHLTVISPWGSIIYIIYISISLLIDIVIG